MLVAAALATPAIVLTTSVPAHATSADSALSVDISGSTVTAGGSSSVTATVLDSQGRPWAGQTVTLALGATPAGTSLGATTGVTNSSGQFTTTLTTDAFTANGATITVTAASGPLTANDSATITGGVTLELAATAAIAESQAGGINAGRANTITATLKNSGGSGISGRTISFSVAGITGTYNSATATTNASGVATVTLTPDTWTTPGTTATVTATTTTGTGTVTTSGTPLVLGANVLVAGWNGTAQLGVGDATNRYVLSQPLPVFPSPVKEIASGGYYDLTQGYFTLFLLEDETVWSVGKNNYGQLGLGNTTDRSTPARIPTLAPIMQIAAGNDTGYALTTAGAVFAWGGNGAGEIGDNTTTERYSPVQTFNLTSGIKQIAANGRSGYALTASDGVKAWGGNDSGQLGDGSTTPRLTPVDVSGLTSGVRAIAAADRTAYAVLSSTGEVRAWGSNSRGQLGNGTSITHSAIPVNVSTLSGIDHLAVGLNTVYARTSGGGLKAWGSNTYTVASPYVSTGMLGNNSTVDSNVPVDVIGLTSEVAQAGGSAFNGYALMDDGSLRAWGYNVDGQLADNQPYGTGPSNSPTTVPSVPVGRVIKSFATRSMSSVSTLLITEP